jgi:hypothetical protein
MGMVIMTVLIIVMVIMGMVIMVMIVRYSKYIYLKGWDGNLNISKTIINKFLGRETHFHQNMLSVLFLREKKTLIKIYGKVFRRRNTLYTEKKLFKLVNPFKYY